MGGRGLTGLCRGRAGRRPFDPFQPALYDAQPVGDRVGLGPRSDFDGPECGLRQFHSHRTQRQAATEGDGQVPPDGRIATALHIT